MPKFCRYAHLHVEPPKCYKVSRKAEQKIAKTHREVDCPHCNYGTIWKKKR